MFFKNRNRTAQTWKKLHRLADGRYCGFSMRLLLTHILV